MLEKANILFLLISESVLDVIECRSYNQYGDWKSYSILPWGE